MSHDDPSTKDATKKAPDCGGSSFLRTGSLPSLARLNVRWTAFSVAAAVLLCGRCVLADDGVAPAHRELVLGDGVFVHIDSPVPVTLAEYLGHDSARVGRRAMGWSETRYVCDSPCDRRIHFSSTDQRYVINGLSFPEAPHVFSLPDPRGDLTITVEPGNHRRRTTGFMMALFGGLGIIAPGPPLVILGVLFGEKPVWGAGIGFVAAAGVTAIVGGVLLATSGAKVKLQKTSVGPVGSVTSIKPRYWMGEF
jgi:hypothetical protein